MARPRKPGALFAIEGARSNRLKRAAQEPQPEGDLNDAPDFLTAEQKASWDYVIAHCPEGMLKLLDRTALLAFAVAESQYLLATAALAREGVVLMVPGSESTTTKNDGKVTTTTTTKHSARAQRSPWFTVQKESFAQMMKAVSEIGLSPTSRAKLKVPGFQAPKKANRFAVNADAAGRPARPAA